MSVKGGCLRPLVCGSERGYNASPGNMVHGVVAVHGIGDAQRRGAFLAQLVNAVADFLEEAGGKVERRFAVESHATAHLTVVDPQGCQQEFAFVEAFWADAFPPPPAKTVLGWLWPQVQAQFVLLWASLRDAANDATFDPTRPLPMARWQRLFSRRGATARVVSLQDNTPTFSWWVRLAHTAWLVTVFALMVVALVVLFPVLAALQLLLILPLPPALGPLGFLGKVAGLVQAVEPFLSHVIGDTYRYVNDGAWAANIRGIVEQLLVQMVKRQDITDITIVAHSQGCAITYDALAEGSPVGKALAENPKRITLVTLGSGVNRIFALAKNSSPYARKRFSLPLDPAVTGAGQEAPREGRHQRFFWLDIYARFDPVPAGPLKGDIIRQAGLDPLQVKRRRVINNDNPMGDHALSAYLDNRDLVLPRLVGALYGDEYPWKEVTRVLPERVRRRTRMVAFLHLPAVLWVWGVVGLVLLLAFWGEGRGGFINTLGPVVQATPGLGSLYSGWNGLGLRAAFLAVLVSAVAGLGVVLMTQALRLVLGKGAK